MTRRDPLLDYPPLLTPSKCFVAGCDNTSAEHGKRMFCEWHHAQFAVRDMDEGWAPERRHGRRWIYRAWRGLLTLVAVVFLVAWLLGAL